MAMTLTGSPQIAAAALDAAINTELTTNWFPLAGVTTNSNAAAGTIGEYLSSSVATSAVALTTATAANITTISLSAGDWDVSGAVGFLPAGTTAPTAFVVSVSTTTATNQPVGDPLRTSILATFATGGAQSFCCGPGRLSLAVTTTVYLVASSNFTVSTMTAGGTIHARRVR